VFQRYDGLGRLTSVVQAGVPGGHAVAEKRVDFAYNAASQFAQLTRYADVSGSQLVANSFYGYDGMGRLLSLFHATDSAPPGEGWGSGILAGYLYGYDAGSRITSIDSYLDGLSECSYDHTSQLTAADHASQADEAYSYDENGNRTGGGYSTGTNNQLLADETYSYTYDDEGNRLTRTRLSDGYVPHYIWDHRNRLIAVVEKDDQENVLSTVEFQYDVHNRRVAKIVDADGPGGSDPASTFFSWESDQIVLAFAGDEADDLSHRYLYGPLVDQVLADDQLTSLPGTGRQAEDWAGPVLWPLADHLGTLRDLAAYDAGQQATAIANHRTFDSFGNITVESNSFVDLIFAFTGRERDNETDLQYHRTRYYDSRNGIWISEDTVGFHGGDTNLLRYVGNSPVIAFDPSGEWLHIFIGAAGGALGGFIFGGIKGGLEGAFYGALGGAVGGAVGAALFNPAAGFLAAQGFGEISSGIIAGIGTGALSGAISAGISGGDPVKGAIVGAITGGALGGTIKNMPPESIDGATKFMCQFTIQQFVKMSQ
jgi:RHS repeat-associated protein